MNIKSGMLAVGTAAAIVVGLAGCVYEDDAVAAAPAPYSRICEDPILHIRVADSDCGYGGAYIWYYYPPTIIYPGIGMRLVSGGYTHISSSYHYTSVSVSRPRVSPARTYATKLSNTSKLSSGSGTSKSYSGSKSGSAYKPSNTSGFRSSSSGGGFRSSSSGGFRK